MGIDDTELTPLTPEEFLDWRKFLGRRQTEGEDIIYVDPKIIKRLMLYTIQLEKKLDGLSIASAERDWDTPEENEAWKDL